MTVKQITSYQSGSIREQSCKRQLYAACQGSPAACGFTFPVFLIQEIALSKLQDQNRKR